MGKETFQGLPITIEFSKGSFKPDEHSALPGAGWTVCADYGYFDDTISYESGDELDVFVGEDEDAPLAYMAYLLYPDGGINEVKVFVGFNTEEEVRQLMGFQYSPERVGPIVAIAVQELGEVIKQQALVAAREDRDDDQEDRPETEEDEEGMIELVSPNSTEVTTLGKAILV